MSLEILGMGDPHLNSESDFNSNDLRKWLNQLDNDEMYDAVFVVGDVVDNVPNDRIEEDTKPEDIELGRYFFGELDKLGEEFGFVTLAEPGNHDYDIHADITEPFENVLNAHNSVFGSEEIGADPGYALIARGASQFDLRPEIDYRNYDFYQSADNRMERKEAMSDLERTLMHAGEADHSLDTIEEAEEYLGIQEGEREQFRCEMLDYFEQHEIVMDLFEQATSEYGEDTQIVFANHYAPFNTGLDSKKVDGTQVNHWGSISDKNAINLYEPVAGINGHHHIGGLDFIEGYTHGTTVMNIGECQAAEIEIDDGVKYNTLN